MNLSEGIFPSRLLRVSALAEDELSARLRAYTLLRWKIVNTPEREEDTPGVGEET